MGGSTRGVSVVEDHCPCLLYAVRNVLTRKRHPARFYSGAGRDRRPYKTKDLQYHAAYFCVRARACEPLSSLQRHSTVTVDNSRYVRREHGNKRSGGRRRDDYGPRGSARHISDSNPGGVSAMRYRYQRGRREALDTEKNIVEHHRPEPPSLGARPSLARLPTPSTTSASPTTSRAHLHIPRRASSSRSSQGPQGTHRRPPTTSLRDGTQETAGSHLPSPQTSVGSCTLMTPRHSASPSRRHRHQNTRLSPSILLTG